MTTTTLTAPVNTGGSAHQLVEIEVMLPHWLRDAVEADARKHGVTPHDRLAAVLEEQFRAGREKLRPIFLKERTVRYIRECCAIADVDPDQWVEGWIGHGDGRSGQVYDSFVDSETVSFSGFIYDIVSEMGDRPKKEQKRLYKIFERKAAEYRRELEQEAAASVEGGAA